MDPVRGPRGVQLKEARGRGGRGAGLLDPVPRGWVDPPALVLKGVTRKKREGIRKKRRDTRTGIVIIEIETIGAGGRIFTSRRLRKLKANVEKVITEAKTEHRISILRTRTKIGNQTKIIQAGVETEEILAGVRIEARAKIEKMKELQARTEIMIWTQKEPQARIKRQ